MLEQQDIKGIRPYIRQAIAFVNFLELELFFTRKLKKLSLSKKNWENEN